MRTAIVYARVSTEDQVLKYGIAAQLTACREYAVKNEIKVIAEFRDEGISGTILDRPGLNKVRELVRSGAVDTVLMLDADRLSRELAHLLILKPELERNATLEFVTAKFEDSASGRMFFGIRGVIAQYERELTRERSGRGQRERARYNDGMLTIYAPEAQWVRQIYDWCAQGHSLRQITLKLRGAGAPTWGKGRWSHSSVTNILGNPVFAGEAHYLKTKRVKGTYTRDIRPVQDQIPIKVPAVVSQELWNRVQERPRTMNTGRPTNRYLLRGLLYGARCGGRMFGDPNKGHPGYRCAGMDALKVAEESRCRMRVKAKLLDGVVWSSIIDASPTPRSCVPWWPSTTNL